MDFRSNEADRIAQKLPIRRCLRIEFPSDHTPLFLVVATPARGSWSFDMDYTKPTDVVASMIDAGVKKLALFHYDQDYSDREVDQLVARGRRLLDERGATGIEIVGAAEGLTLSL